MFVLVDVPYYVLLVYVFSLNAKKSISASPVSPALNAKYFFCSPNINSSVYLKCKRFKRL